MPHSSLWTLIFRQERAWFNSNRVTGSESSKCRWDRFAFVASVMQRYVLLLQQLITAVLMIIPPVISVQRDSCLCSEKTRNFNSLQTLLVPVPGTLLPLLACLIHIHYNLYVTSTVLNLMYGGQAYRGVWCYCKYIAGSGDCQCLDSVSYHVKDLHRLLCILQARLPALTYLSLLGNEACPDQLSNQDKDEDDYRRYR